MLRFAALHGVFGTVPSTRKGPQSASSLVFRNNRLSDTLRSDHELSQKAMVCTAHAMGLFSPCVKVPQKSGGWVLVECVTVTMLPGSHATAAHAVQLVARPFCNGQRRLRMVTR